MRRLLLIRHAKSSWKDLDVGDHERPLNKRGERDSLSMARHLADKDEHLDVIYSSTANRALDYAQLLSDFSGTELVADLSFYTFEDFELLEILKNLPESATRVAVVAHNPAITRVVNQLTMAELRNVPTAGIVAIDYCGDEWQDIGDVAGQCELDYFDFPKMLQGE
jgi:phosphohistidine phosphatase